MSNMTNSSNTTSELLWREYSVGFFVSSVFYSGSSDNLYFQLCSTNYAACTAFYMIEGGMPNTGETYYFMFNTTNIGDINHAILGANGSDRFCLAGIKVDDVKISNTIPDCLDTDSDGSCDVLNITLSSESFISSTQSPCQLDLSVLYTPPIFLPNNTRLYEMSFTVSSLPYSGSEAVIWFRLCNRTDYAALGVAGLNCTDWDNLGFTLEDTGSTYTLDYIPDDVGSISTIQLLTYDDDQLCLGEVTVDSRTDSFTACIENSGDSESCDTLWIVFGDLYDSQEYDVCPYPITSNSSIVKVDEYTITFEVSSIPGFGTDDYLYFFFYSFDGSSSTIYKIIHSLDYGEEYSFTVSITDEDGFNSLSDIYLLYLFTIGNDKFCLSSFTISDLWSSDFLPSPCIEYSGVAGDGGCDILKMNVATGDDIDYQNSTCPFDYANAVDIGSAAALSWYEWLETYWYIMASAVLGSVLLCICCCWIMFYIAKKKKKKRLQAAMDRVKTNNTLTSDDEIIKNTLSYGGNSAFH